MERKETHSIFMKYDIMRSLLFYFLCLGQTFLLAQAGNHEEWGHYYDPQEVFCGSYDCYQILGLGPDENTLTWDHYKTRDIIKAYRALSRVWHPDKNRSEEAKEKFVHIAKAYEVLSDSERRSDYDNLRGRPEEYVMKYGANVLWKYAPKSNFVAVLLLVLVLFSVLMWYLQLQHWQTIADALVKAAVENLGPKNGGSTESIDIRRRAEEEWQATDNAIAGALDDMIPEKDKSSKKGKGRGKGRANKQQQVQENLIKNEQLRPIIVRLVNEIDDFGGGYRKPVWPHDLVIVRFCLFPYNFGTSALWMSKYFFRRIFKKTLNDEELEYRTIAAIGIVAWDAASKEDQEEMKKQELWLPGKLVEWEEYQEFQQMSKTQQKHYLRWKKREDSKSKKGD